MQIVERKKIFLDTPVVGSFELRAIKTNGHSVKCYQVHLDSHYESTHQSQFPLDKKGQNQALALDEFLKVGPTILVVPTKSNHKYSNSHEPWWIDRRARLRIVL